MIIASLCDWLSLSIPTLTDFQCPWTNVTCLTGTQFYRNYHDRTCSNMAVKGYYSSVVDVTFKFSVFFHILLYKKCFYHQEKWCLPYHYHSNTVWMSYKICGLFRNYSLEKTDKKEKEDSSMSILFVFPCISIFSFIL